MTSRLRRVAGGVRRRSRAVIRAVKPPRTDDSFSALPLGSQRRVVAALAEERSRAIARYRTVVELLRLQARQSDEHAALYRQAVRRLGVDELTLFDVVMISRNQGWPLEHGDAFFRKMVERRRMKQLGPVPERRLGLTKGSDLAFARAAGVRVPTTLWTGKLTEIPAELRRGTFLKPTQSSGAKGAFYLFEDGSMFSVFATRQVERWDDLVSACRQQVRPGVADEMTWEIQELVAEGPSSPARDMKFFAFYGEIGLIQEVVRYPRKQYEFFDPDGRIAPCGRDRSYETPFLDPADTITDKGGLSEEKIETARRLSLEIPTPFMRIDFLNGEKELVFCEFSASPGMSHTFNRRYDRILGRMYNAASVRLTNDLLAGKTFDAYHRWVTTTAGGRRPAEGA